MPIRGTFQMLDVTSLSPGLTLMLSAVVSKHSENFEIQMKAMKNIQNASQFHRAHGSRILGLQYKLTVNLTQLLH